MDALSHTKQTIDGCASILVTVNAERPPATRLEAARQRLEQMLSSAEEKVACLRTPFTQDARKHNLQNMQEMKSKDDRWNIPRQ